MGAYTYTTRRATFCLTAAKSYLAAVPKALVYLGIGLLTASCSMQQGICLRGEENDDDNMSTKAVHPVSIFGTFLAMDAGEKGAEDKFYEEAEYTNYQIVKYFLEKRKEVQKQEKAVEEVEKAASKALLAPRKGKKVRRRNIYGSFAPIPPMDDKSEAYKSESEKRKEKCERELDKAREAYERAYESLKSYAKNVYSKLQKGV